MANNCFYQITVIGEKESCETWLKKMKSYEEENHFYKFYSSEVYGEDFLKDGKYRMEITGNCAWALESCCRASGYSNGKDLFEINTRDLKLKMEAYSEGPVLGFAEHYIYDNGKCILEECVKYSEYHWDKSDFPVYESYKNNYFKKYRENPPEEDKFDEQGICKIGGFNWDSTI